MALNKLGDKGENKWAAYLESRGYAVQRAPNEVFYDWDMKAVHPTAGEQTFEVKYDQKAYYWAKKRKDVENPNIYIEYKNTSTGKDSGIFASKANFYVYIVKDVSDIAYVFKRLDLCDFLLSSSFLTAGNSATGDDNSLGWIPPLKELVKTRCFVKEVNLDQC